ANGANPTSQEFSLPQGTNRFGGRFWTRSGNTGFTYTDLLGEQGPVRLVVIRRFSSGRFNIQAAAVGSNGMIMVVPPNPGTDAFMTLKLGLAPDAGDRYCVQYGPESKIKNIGSKLFSAKDPKIKGCPSGGGTTTTTVPATTTTTTTAPTTT